MEIRIGKHAKGRLSLRMISKTEVIETLNNGLCCSSNSEDSVDDIFKCTYKNVEVVFKVNVVEQEIFVLTVMHTSEFNKDIRRLARKNKISARQATRELKAA